MIRALLRHLLVNFLIVFALLIASAVLPVAGFWLCQSQAGGTVFFCVAPWTAAIWCLFIVQLGGSRFWRGAAQVRAWRAAHGGYKHTILRGTAWMFGGLILSYACEIAYMLLFPAPLSVLARSLFPFATYAPSLLAMWSAARG